MPTVQLRSLQDPSVVIEGPEGVPWNPKEWAPLGESPSPSFLQGLARAVVPTSGTPGMEMTGRRGAAGARMLTPEAQAGEAEAARRASAFLARMIPGLASANPFLSGPLSAGGEALGQLIEGGEVSSPGAVAGAAAIPPVMAGVGRAARAIGRTATRLSPTLFRAAHEKALESIEGVAQALRSSEAAEGLFAAARSKGTQIVRGENLRRVIGELDFKVPAEPASGALATVRGHIRNVQVLLGGGDEMTLKGMNQLRNDLRQTLMSGPAPQREGARAIYGALLTDLEAAAARGGDGATLLKGALMAFKRDLGATKFRQFADESIRETSIGKMPALNIGRLSAKVRANHEELLKLVGDDGMRLIDKSVERLRGLPPETAYTVWNSMLAAASGGLGLGSGGAGGLVFAFVPELVKNGFAVGKNPAMLNRTLTGLSQAARAIGQPGLAGAQP